MKYILIDIFMIDAQQTVTIRIIFKREVVTIVMRTDLLFLLRT